MRTMRNRSARRSDEAPAIVMGLGPIGLALARTLGRAGIDVIGISADDNPPAAHSRLFRFRRGPAAGDDGATLDFYLELAAELRGPAVLLPTGDLSALFIVEHSDQLEPHFRYLLPSADDMARIVSKRRFVQVAADLGLPLPRTVLPATRSELAEISSAFRYPCLIKPEFTYLWRTSAARAAGLRTSKAIEVADVTELLSSYDELALIDSRLVVQEKILGPDENQLDYLALVDLEGCFRAEFAIRKLRTFPPHLGIATYCESAPVESVAETGRFILKQLAYRGMGWVQLKRDERDGKLYLYEINTRFGMTIGLPISCGIDFASYYYRACAGEPYDVQASYPIGKRWLNFTDDRKSLSAYRRDGTWSRTRWLASLPRASTWALFAKDDPAPSWVSFRRWIRHSVLHA
jgi:D-aspartate ligase